MEEPLVVSVPGGPSLEGRLALVPAPKGGFVLCHPHPLYGGDMDNPVVIRAAEVVREAGHATLRFNFRGVGSSTGSHDKGAGEQDDVRAAVAALAGHLPPGLIAPPLGMFDFQLPASPGRMLVVAGTRDTYCPVEALHQLARTTGAEE